MTTENINITSPPTSPPAKRVKTSPESTTTTTTTTTTTVITTTAAAETETMADSTTTTNNGNTNGGSSANNTVVPVTLADQAPPLLIKKLSEAARLPTRGSAFAAGYDLYAARDTTVPARGKALVDTDISMAVPAGTYGRIAPRSGLAAKNFIDTGAGVIDADYRGPVKVLLFNHSDADFAVAAGDRVAQLVLERIYTPEVLEVAELEASVRGAGGFGSTGTGVN
ncbi:dUTPase-like protein [Lasiosphaeria ovina]|uniref:Deoxyuridine 5'-triphosphate nucleotidohydrolase n=1 Tax=Lasiosphaeria ovina TaxID=92902 RepID=A0AAE0NLP6_9PEZI|nr:dUTPase-like protein [Lasiosphaeria ovina]